MRIFSAPAVQSSNNDSCSGLSSASKRVTFASTLATEYDDEETRSCDLFAEQLVEDSRGVVETHPPDWGPGRAQRPTPLHERVEPAGPSDGGVKGAMATGTGCPSASESQTEGDEDGNALSLSGNRDDGDDNCTLRSNSSAPRLSSPLPHISTCGDAVSPLPACDTTARARRVPFSYTHFYLHDSAVTAGRTRLNIYRNALVAGQGDGPLRAAPPFPTGEDSTHDAASESGSIVDHGNDAVVFSVSSSPSASLSSSPARGAGTPGAGSPPLLSLFLPREGATARPATMEGEDGFKEMIEAAACDASHPAVLFHSPSPIDAGLTASGGQAEVRRMPSLKPPRSCACRGSGGGSGCGHGATGAARHADTPTTVGAQLSQYHLALLSTRVEGLSVRELLRTQEWDDESEKDLDSRGV